MRILPSDLGERWHVALLQRRCHISDGSGAQPPTDAPAPHLGFWGRLWARGTGLSRERAAATLPTAGTLNSLWGLCNGLTVGFVGLIASIASAKAHAPPEQILALWSALTALAGSIHYLGPRDTFMRMNREPVKPGEIDQLLERCTDEVEHAFLVLVRDAVRVQGSRDAEESARAAIQALSEAIRCLPVVTVEPIDTDALRREAEELLRRAREEPDSITAEALERNARARLIRAQTHEHSALTVRRCEALRAEIGAEIEAVREGLAAQQLPGETAGALATLARAARQVAAEASDFASAREELAAALAPGKRPGPGEEPLSLRTGSG
jgi:hypothetical protein